MELTDVIFFSWAQQSILLYDNGVILPIETALIRKFHASHYIKGLHEVVRHIIGAQRGVGYASSP
jgi:hypothetical protein